jgi:NO-binding membrane sensor protein with MHYT domain
MVQRPRTPQEPTRKNWLWEALLGGLILFGLGIWTMLSSYSNAPSDFNIGLGLAAVGVITASVAGYKLSRQEQKPH